MKPSTAKNTTDTPYLQNMMERFPNYQNFTAKDFEKLENYDISVILGLFATREPRVKSYIPFSFIKKYGDQAPTEMVLALERVAAKRGITEAPAGYVLETALVFAAGLQDTPNGYLDADVSATTTITRNDGSKQTVTASAAELLSYSLSKYMLSTVPKREQESAKGTLQPSPEPERVAIPEYLVKAVVEASQKFDSKKDPDRFRLPTSVVANGVNFLLGPEAAYMAGYSASSEGKKINPDFHLDYTAGSNGADMRDKVFCRAPIEAQKIFSPTAGQQHNDATIAWVYGYIQADMDRLPKAELDGVMRKCPNLKTAAMGR